MIRYSDKEIDGIFDSLKESYKIIDFLKKQISSLEDSIKKEKEDFNALLSEARKAGVKLSGRKIKRV